MLGSALDQATPWTQHPFASPGFSFFVCKMKGFNHTGSNTSFGFKVFRRLSKVMNKQPHDNVLKLPAVNYPLRQLWITLKQSALCLSPRKSASESGRVIHSHWKSTLAFSRNTSQVPLVTRQAQGWALPGIGEAHWWGCLLDPKNFGRRKRSPLAASWSRV